MQYPVVPRICNFFAVSRVSAQGRITRYQGAYGIPVLQGTWSLWKPRRTIRASAEYARCRPGTAGIGRARPASYEHGRVLLGRGSHTHLASAVQLFYHKKAWPLEDRSRLTRDNVAYGC